MTSLTATDARRQLFPLIKKVNDDIDHVEIVSKHGSAVLVSKDEWDSIAETAYLLRSPANAARLTRAADRFRRGEYTVHELDTE